jgi:hypothetical protein
VIVASHELVLLAASIETVAAAKVPHQAIFRLSHVAPENQVEGDLAHDAQCGEGQADEEGNRGEFLGQR